MTTIYSISWDGNHCIYERSSLALNVCLCVSSILSKQIPCLCSVLCAEVALFSKGAQDPSPPRVSRKSAHLTQPIQSLMPADAHDFTDRPAAGLLYLLGGWIDWPCLLSQGENNSGRPRYAAIWVKGFRECRQLAGNELGGHVGNVTNPWRSCGVFDRKTTFRTCGDFLMKPVESA